jgi:pSer/pThr/pTyr-binding forkhead associated (FHA) protein
VIFNVPAGLRLVTDKFSLRGRTPTDDHFIYRVPDNAEEIRLGRYPTFEVVLMAREIAKMQATICKREGRWFIFEYSRRNPTYVNGQEFEEKPLEHDDVITVGTRTFLRWYVYDFEEDDGRF